MSTAIKKADPSLNEKVLRMEDYIIKNCDPVELEWVHRFVPGLYAREMKVDAGTLVTGAIHKTEHLSIFLEGAMMIPNMEGGDPEVIEAPIVEICQPGVKRAGIAITDCRWITFHATEDQDVEALEDAFFTNDPREAPLLEEPAGYEVTQKNFGLGQRNLLK